MKKSITPSGRRVMILRSVVMAHAWYHWGLAKKRGVANYESFAYYLRRAWRGAHQERSSYLRGYTSCDTQFTVLL